MTKKKPKKNILQPQKISTFNPKTDVDVFAAEVNALVDKYAQHKNVSIVGDPSGTESGFYLLFINLTSV